MHLLVIYCVVVAVGGLIAFGVGLLVEEVLPSLSMVIFVMLLFGVMWGGWLLSVQISQRWSPSDSRSRSSAKS
jgi:hypothetical protein